MATERGIAEMRGIARDCGFVHISEPLAELLEWLAEPADDDDEQDAESRH